MRLLSLISFIVTILYANTNLLAQQAKNPKVVEVETYLNQKAVTVIKNRFPYVPMLVNLTVTPLRRNPGEASLNSSTDNLPYYSPGTEIQALDEWDDPNKTVADLLPRMQTVSIQITMPSYIGDDELFELRDVLYANLHIIPGRDKVEFVRKNWKRGSDFATEWMALIIGSLLFLSITIILSLRYLALRISDSFSSSESTKAINHTPPAPSLTSATRQTQPNFPVVKQSTGLQFNDTMKVGEKLQEVIKQLESDPGFPCLEDMIDLETLAKSNSRFLGTILQGMSKSMQEKVFERSSDASWLEAFFDQAPVEIEHYHFAMKLAFRKRNSDHLAWQELLIALWRLGSKLKPFIQSLEQRDALGILAWMPTTISVPTARESFPGGWGILLRHDFQPPPLDGKACKELIKQCLDIFPYNKMMMLEKFRHERGLLQFLRFCTIDEERDIYKASKADASIHIIRPPFYAVFDGGDDILAKLVEMISAHDWGVALFNVDRSLRSKVTNHLSDAQNYILIETIKSCDQNGLEKNDIWLMREKIAKIFHTLKKDFNLEASDLDAANDVEELGNGPKVA